MTNFFKTSLLLIAAFFSFQAYAEKNTLFMCLKSGSSSQTPPFDNCYIWETTATCDGPFYQDGKKMVQGVDYTCTQLSGGRVKITRKGQYDYFYDVPTGELSVEQVGAPGSKKVLGFFKSIMDRADKNTSLKIYDEGNNQVRVSFDDVITGNPVGQELGYFLDYSQESISVAFDLNNLPNQPSANITTMASPNPTCGSTTINVSGTIPPNTSLKVSRDGSTFIINQAVSSNSITFDLTTYPAGLYYAFIVDANGVVLSCNTILKN